MNEKINSDSFDCNKCVIRDCCVCKSRAPNLNGDISKSSASVIYLPCGKRRQTTERPEYELSFLGRAHACCLRLQRKELHVALISKSDRPLGSVKMRKRSRKFVLLISESERTLGSVRRRTSSAKFVSLISRSDKPLDSVRRRTSSAKFVSLISRSNKPLSSVSRRMRSAKFVLVINKSERLSCMLRGLDPKLPKNFARSQIASDVPDCIVV